MAFKVIRIKLLDCFLNVDKFNWIKKVQIKINSKTFFKKMDNFKSYQYFHNVWKLWKFLKLAFSTKIFFSNFSTNFDWKNYNIYFYVLNFAGIISIPDYFEEKQFQAKEIKNIGFCLLRFWHLTALTVFLLLSWKNDFWNNWLEITRSKIVCRFLRQMNCTK